MVTVPGATPVTMPDDVPTVAIAGSLVVHVPPALALANVVVSSGHTTAVPVIGAGAVFTVTVVVTGTALVVHSIASVTVSVYTPAAPAGAAVIVGVSIALANDNGPAQL